MADTLTTIQYSLGRIEQKLKDLTTTQYVSPLMALARDGKGIATIRKHGRGLTAYFNIMLRPPGSFAIVTEGGAYPATKAESETQASLALKMFAMTLGYSEHALVGLASDPSAIKVDVNVKIRKAVDHVQRKMCDQFAGRGDGSVGRANGAGATGTTITFDEPPLCQVGDVIYSNPTRAFATDGGESGKIEGATVTDVKYDSLQVVIAADTWDDGDVIHLAGQAENSGGDTNWVQGLQAAYDIGDSTNWKYDAEDGTTYDHCDSYLTLDRASVGQANVAEYNVNGYPTNAKVQRLVQRCLSRGAQPKNLRSLWNPLTYDKYCEGIEGYAPRSVDLKLPGGKFRVPVIAHGMTEVPVITDERIPRTKIIGVDNDKMFRLTAPGGWNRRAGQFWKHVPSGSTTILSKYMALFDIWYNFAVVLPNTACVGYGVSTS